MAKLIVGVNDLATVNPQLAKEWHPTKNGELKPTDVTAGSERKVWWFLPYDDPKTGKHFNFEWETSIFIRTGGSDCPYLSNQAVWAGFNDLATTNLELVKEWHPTKNGNLKPTDITAGSKKNIWWLYPFDDPKTGKHFDFEWKASPNGRTRGNGCPYLSNQAVWAGFNDLATTNPELAKEWHPTKNEELRPCEISARSGKKVWWLLPYDDPKTRKHFDFEWRASPDARARGRGCPYLSGKAVWVGFNDLETYCIENKKEYILEQWHPTKNGNLKPTDIYGY